MEVYLTQWVPIQAGQRPDGSPQPGYAPEGVDISTEFNTLDLRGDTLEGPCLLATPDTIPKLVKLGNTEELDRPALAMRRNVRTALGIDLADTTLRMAIAELYFQRGQQLRPTVAGRYEIEFGGKQIISLPKLAGGASFSDDFNRSDNDDPGSGTWAEQVGDWDILSNALLLFAINGNCSVRASTDLGGADHYAQAVVSQLASDGNSSYGVCTRFAAAATTFYLHRFSKATGTYQIWYVTGDNYNFLTQGGSTTVVGDTIKGESNGSTQTCYRNGTSQVTTTHATLTNTRAGIYGNNTNGATKVMFDNYASGLLGAAFQAAWARRANALIGAGVAA